MNVVEEIEAFQSLNCSKNWDIHPAKEYEWRRAMDLAWKTFLRFEAGDYTNEGINNFHDFIRDERLYNLFLNGHYELYVACKGEQIVGMITKRGTHFLSLLFVDQNYHRQGVGSALITYLSERLSKQGEKEMTVNAAPYALNFYRRLGFIDTDGEVEKEGIRYTPMVYRFK